MDLITTRTGPLDRHTRACITADQVSSSHNGTAANRVVRRAVEDAHAVGGVSQCEGSGDVRTDEVAPHHGRPAVGQEYAGPLVAGDDVAAAGRRPADDRADYPVDVDSVLTVAEVGGPSRVQTNDVAQDDVRVRAGQDDGDPIVAVAADDVAGPCARHGREATDCVALGPAADGDAVTDVAQSRRASGVRSDVVSGDGVVPGIFARQINATTAGFGDDVAGGDCSSADGVRLAAVDADAVASDGPWCDTVGQ